MSEQLTAQQVFDTVVDHLRQQKSVSRGNLFCVYRSVDGKKCAAGCLIRDDEYYPTMEGKSFSEVLTDRCTSPSLVERLANHTVLISKLQAAHDRCSKPSPPFLEQLEPYLEMIAEDCNLIYTPPEPSNA